MSSHSDEPHRPVMTKPQGGYSPVHEPKTQAQNTASAVPSSGPYQDQARSASVDSKNDGKTLYVSGMGRRVKEKFLWDLFLPFGEIEDVKLIKDQITNESRGFAFIKFKVYEDAKKAVDKLNGDKVEGGTLTVQLSHRGKERRKTPGEFLGRKEGERRRRRSFDDENGGRRKSWEEENGGRRRDKRGVYDKYGDWDRLPERDRRRDRDRDRDRGRDEYEDRYRERDRDRDRRPREREGDRDYRVRDRDRYGDRDRDRDRDRRRDTDRDRERERDRERDRNRDRDRNIDRDREKERDRDREQRRDNGNLQQKANSPHSSQSYH